MTLQRTSRLAAMLAAGSLALAACGGSDNGGTATTNPTASSSGSGKASLSGRLSGAGASTQTAAMEAWIAGFQGDNSDVTVNYDPIGSGGGRKQFLSGGTDFAGSDAFLKDEELTMADQRCGKGGLVEAPVYISPIALAFNLKGIDSLNLGPATIAGIFKQEIKKWNDPKIAADNPDAKLPDLAITPVNRSDNSGTTENFTDYLAAVAPDVWTFKPSGDWPVPGGEAGKGTAGVVQAVTAAEGAIGYADASQVADLGTVAVRVGEEFVKYSPEGAAAVVANSPRVEGRPEGSIAIKLNRNTRESGDYPIVLVSYQLACKSYDDAAKAALVKGFLTYTSSEKGQKAAADAAGSAPISDELRKDVQAQVEQIAGA